MIQIQYIRPILEHIPFQHPCKSLYINFHPNKSKLDEMNFLFCMLNIAFRGSYSAYIARQNYEVYSPEYCREVQTLPFDRDVKSSVNAMCQ